MCSHFLVRPQACTPASGWGKGRVEKQVLDLRRALLSGGELQFGSLDELNEHLQAGFVRYSRDTRHPEFRDKSAYEVFLEERSSLIPFAGDFDAWSASAAKVTKTLLVNFGKNRYRVAARAKRPAVDVRAYSDEVEILLYGEAVAEHDRSFARGETIYDPMHYLPVLRRKPGTWRNGAPFIDWKLPAAMQQVRERLRSFSDSDRQLVSVRTAAEQLGFECLEQACREALEQGCCHADVILNHAHQLQQPAAAQSVSTPAHLRLRQPPKADCRRYDDLTGGKR